VAALDISTLAYVYAVTWASAGPPLRGDGIGGGGLTLVEHRDLAAIASPVERGSLQARRRDLLRHTDVVQEAFERAAVVPLRFGTVLADTDAVVDELLAPRHDELVGLLRRLEGQAELTVRAFYREQDVLRTLLAEQPRLAHLRTSASPLELGEAVTRALAARRDADAIAINTALEPFAREVAFDERRTELEVLRAAYLVDLDRIAAVDAALDRVARTQADTTVFKVVGPLAPHHFAALQPRTGAWA
jgi:hypothetical protein